MSETQQDIEQLLGTDSLTIRGVDILTEGLLLDAYEDHGFAPLLDRPGKDQGIDATH